MHLGVVAKAANVVCQVQRQRALDLIGAEVRELCVEAGDALSLGVVLLKGKANGVLVFYPALLAGIRVLVVELGEPYLAEAQLASLEADHLREINTLFGCARRLNVAADRGGAYQGLVELVVSGAILEDILGVHRPDPLSIRGLFDVLGLDWIYTAVEGYVFLFQGDSRHRCQRFRDRNLYIGIAMFSARPSDYVANLLPGFFFQHRANASRSFSMFRASLTREQPYVKITYT